MLAAVVFFISQPKGKGARALLHSQVLQVLHTLLAHQLKAAALVKPHECLAAWPPHKCAVLALHPALPAVDSPRLEADMQSEQVSLGNQCKADLLLRVAGGGPQPLQLTVMHPGQ